MLPVLHSTDLVAVHYLVEPAIVSRVYNLRRPLPHVEAGTGGSASMLFLQQSIGYRPYLILQPSRTVDEAPYARLMEQVKAGFGRTLSRLPEVFSVSRQTLYNWLDGETPKLVHQERLRQLAEAAQVFADLGVKPTTPMLDRTVSQGKSFIQLMASNADGKETAKKLIRLIQSGNASRTKLEKLLTGRKASLVPADLGAPALDEDA